MASENVQPVTDTDFEQSVVKSQTPVLVDFWAEWCGPCKRVAPVVDQLAAEYAGRLIVVKMNVDENPEVPTRLGIQGIPTLLLYKQGSVVASQVGAVNKDVLKKMVDEHV